ATRTSCITDWHWSYGCFVFLNKTLVLFLKPILRLIPSEKIIMKIKEFYLAIHGYKNHRRILFGAIIVSFVVQLILFFFLYLLAYAIHIDVSIALFYAFMPIVCLASIAPSLNGLGVREVMFVYFLGKYCGAEGALAISVLMDILLIFLGIVGGILFAFSGKMKLKDLNSTSPSSTV
ncbi:lysylphosphatidylglycerol synthase domain-containing protein, partial [Candidatus Omnitrophota bacterium]